ncbi:MAG: hypothetical protein BGO43_06370 [Gammaproteobacteria bacterium 39-13]|nr:MAG: hypothetical protein BGO43_06370 [Gammaproteobacteria bacterium 39-13]
MNGMRTLLLGILMSLISVCYAGYPAHDYHVEGKWWDGQGKFRSYRDGMGYRDGYSGYGYYYELDCYQRHKPGHNYFKHHGRYYPDYYNPRFFVYGDHLHYRPFVVRSAKHTRGFYRCYDREGLSVECYKQTGRRG